MPRRVRCTRGVKRSEHFYYAISDEYPNGRNDQSDQSLSHIRLNEK